MLEWIADKISGGRLTEYKDALLRSQDDVRYQGRKCADMWRALRDIRYIYRQHHATRMETTMAKMAADVLDKWSVK